MVQRFIPVFMRKFVTNKKRILVLSRYDTMGASSRVRMYQYISILGNNFEFTISPFFSNNILNRFYLKNKRNPFSLINAYLKRLFTLIISYRYDYIWIEKEVFPFLPGFLDTLFLRSKYFLDFDDAIFHNYDYNKNILLNLFFKEKLKRLIQGAQHIFVGNKYLYDYVSTWNTNISILYSVVDESKYKQKNTKISKDKFTIGWIGSPSTTKYLLEIIEYLEEISKKYPIRLVTVGASKINNNIFEVVQLEWKLEEEINYINMFDVGIMPLYDNLWEKGKCGFKLIQYMSCSIPVIASPVGINKEIVTEDVGFLANSRLEWISSLDKLINDEHFRKNLGSNARKRIEKFYSYSKNMQILKTFFNK